MTPAALRDRQHWVFDMDGTLTLAIHDFPAIKRALDIPQEHDILAHLAQLPEDEAAAKHAWLLAHERELALAAQPAPGARELVQTLCRRGCQLGILTRNALPLAELTLEVIGLRECFAEAAILGRDEAPPKPDPGGLLHLAAYWQVPSSRLVMVGDYRYDLECARQAGACAVLVNLPDNPWPQLTFDYALLVIDSRRGIGNGHLVPGGPVRAPLDEQMRQANALLAIGNGNAADALIRQAARAGKAIHSATLVTVGAEDLAEKVVMAWSGIADNEKFFRTVTETGAHLYVTRSFPDHHHLSEDEVSEILDHAEGVGYQLVTTAKDSVRLAGEHGRAEELQEKSRVIEVEIRFDDPKGPDAIIDAAIVGARRRKLHRLAAK